MTNVVGMRVPGHVKQRIYSGAIPHAGSLGFCEYTCVEPHNHEFYEISIILYGKATHITENSTEEISPGSVLVLSPYATHAIMDFDCLVQQNIYYLPAWLGDDMESLWREPGLVHLFLADSLWGRASRPSPPHFDLLPNELEMSILELKHIFEELEDSVPSLLYLRACLLKILIKMSVAHFRQVGFQQEEHFRKEVWAALDSIEQCVQQGGVPVISGIASACGISPDYLNRLFRVQTGLGLMQFFQRRRSMVAARLLMDPDATVTSVAHRLGYSDASHLGRLFRRFHGTSPRAYMQRYNRA